MHSLFKRALALSVFSIASVSSATVGLKSQIPYANTFSSGASAFLATPGLKSTTKYLHLALPVARTGVFFTPLTEYDGAPKPSTKLVALGSYAASTDNFASSETIAGNGLG